MADRVRPVAVSIRRERLRPSAFLVRNTLARARPRAEPACRLASSRWAGHARTLRAGDRSWATGGAFGLGGGEGALGRKVLVQWWNPSMGPRLHSRITPATILISQGLRTPGSSWLRRGGIRRCGSTDFELRVGSGWPGSPAAAGAAGRIPGGPGPWCARAGVRPAGDPRHNPAARGRAFASSGGGEPSGS